MPTEPKAEADRGLKFDRDSNAQDLDGDCIELTSSCSMWRCRIWKNPTTMVMIMNKLIRVSETLFTRIDINLEASQEINSHHIKDRFFIEL